MDIKQLIVFVAVAETESFSVASTRCGLTQSAVSHQIKSLENDLGAELFTRTSHEVKLTESGAALYDKARTIIKEAENTKDLISSINGKVSGELRIGVGSFIEPYIRKAAIEMIKRYPDVRLNVTFGKASTLNNLLRNHEIDLAFTMNIAYREENIESQPCIPFRLSAVMSKTHPLASKSKVAREDLFKHYVIMPDIGDRPFETIQKYAKIDFSKMKIKAIVNEPHAAMMVLDELKLITFLPSMYVFNNPSFVAKPIEGLEMELMSNSHWMKDVYLKRSAKVFLDLIKTYAVPYYKSLEL